MKGCRDRPLTIVSNPLAQDPTLSEDDETTTTTKKMATVEKGNFNIELDEPTKMAKGDTLPSYQSNGAHNGVNGEGFYRTRPYYAEDPHHHHQSPPPNWNRKFRSEDSLARYVGIKDVCGNQRLWKMLVAEFVGTLFLVLIGCGSCISGWSPNYAPSMVQIALAFGVTVASMAQAIGHISGCHINPAVTIGLLAAGQMSFLKSFVYILAQCVGAICGSAILQTVTPTELQGNLGMTTISPKLEPLQGMFLEALITFVLVLTVCGVCDDLRKDIKGSAPLAIGLSIMCCHLMAIQYTGSSMNPARSLGPAVIAKVWDHHWVYWAGPMLGGVSAGFLYAVSFRESPKHDEIS